MQRNRDHIARCTVNSASTNIMPGKKARNRMEAQADAFEEFLRQTQTEKDAFITPEQLAEKEARLEQLRIKQMLDQDDDF
eukprot:g27999.t1